ncbi:MAG: 4Fe-4S dicluster domain-containing protein [Hyphomicrobiaceae bacterium]
MTSLLTRRDLFGRSKAGKPEQRPPWSRPEAEFLEACARCGACIEACPTGVLVEGSSQYPAIRFGTAACTLCAACAQACPTTCFDAELDPPWPVKELSPEVGDGVNR